MSGRLTDAEFLDALDDLIIEDILAMSGDELRAEIVAEGKDPDAIEAECRAALERAIREAEGTRSGEAVSDPGQPGADAEKAPAGKLPAVASFW